MSLAMVAATHIEVKIDTEVPSEPQTVCYAEINLPDAAFQQGRSYSSSVSSSSASTSLNSSSSSSSSSSTSSQSSYSSDSSSLSAQSLDVTLPESAPSLPLALVSSSSSSSSSGSAPGDSATSLGCLSNPYFASSRHIFLFVSSSRFLRTFFVLQLALHLAFLAAAIYLLCSRAQLQALVSGQSQSTVSKIMMQLPAWLLARSVVSVALSVRRLVLGAAWRSSRWEAAWCVVVMWASTLVFGIAGMQALGQVNDMNTAFMVMWIVVAALLMLVAAHISFYNLCLLLFPLSLQTLAMPVMPLDPWLYYDTPSLPSPRSQRPHQGLTQQQLDTLPVTTCTVLRDDPCAVCMDEVELGEAERVLRCGHAYHQQCIDVWLLKRRVCPLCVRAVRPSQSRSSSASECGVELADKRRPSLSQEQVEA